MSKALRALRATALSAALMIGGTTAASAAQFYSFDLTTLNGSGVTGSGTITINDDASMLTIQLTATGLEPNMNHPGHIHGLFNSAGMPTNSTTPTLANDSDGDGFIELAEGQTSYGPVILSLAGLSDPGPEAPTGTLNYSESFNLLDPMIYADNNMDGIPDFDREDLLGPGLNSLQLREIVLHGMTVPAGIGAGTPGEVDGTNGYLAVLPVASGEIVRSSAGAVPEPSTWAMMLLGFGATGMIIRRRREKILQIG